MDSEGKSFMSPSEKEALECEAVAKYLVYTLNFKRGVDHCISR